mmetsp:Transcript_29571/g.93280  ORF Transcript_29571/g.93280 Transcript_29571/m.93280 type:complete len:470 (-) Transcript_29571:278-1687(-)
MAALDPLNPEGLPRWDPDAAVDGALPASAYAREVAELPAEDRRVLGRTCGPAVKFAALGVLLHSLLWLATPLAEFALAQCPEDGQLGVGVVAAPLDFLTLVGYLVFFAPPQLYCQWKCMQYVIITQLEVTGRFKLIGVPIYHLGYYCLFIMCSLLMCTEILNTLTNGQVMGRIAATYACGAPYGELETLWQGVMNQALIHKVPGFHHSSFLRISIFCYALHLAIPLFAWVYARPRWSRFVDYNVRRGTQTEYRTIYNCTPIGHGAAVMVLASLARFAAVCFQDLTYATVLMEDISKRKARGWELDYLKVARVELDRAIARFAIVGILLDVMQTSLQTTVVGIDWHLAKKNSALSQSFLGGLDLQMFVSVILCFISTVVDLADAVDVIKIARRVCVLFPVGGTYHLGLKERRLLRHVRRKLLRFCVYMLFFVGMTVWSLAKLVALFACSDRLWDFNPGVLLHANFELGCA